MELPPPSGAGPESTGTDNEQHEGLRAEGPRIYVASLSDYNAGILHGAWLHADQDLDDLRAGVAEMLDRSPTPGAEEFAIHDHEGFGHYRVGEYDSLEWINRIARGISEHGLALAAWAAEAGRDEDALACFEDTYLGEWESVEAYAEELFSDLGYQQAIEKAVPEWLQPYVKLDVEGFARDLELGGDVTAVDHEGGVWVFAARR